MEVPFSVIAILSLAASLFFLNVTRDPKTWRLRWMDLLGVMDMDANRERRKSQESQVVAMAVMLFVLTLATSLSSAYWTVDQIRHRGRVKTRFEREIDLTRSEIDGVQGKR
tara:strand:+ start:423 stop:755 length:333 start_codon:yes stop_codon:yes gene_type:complete